MGTNFESFTVPAPTGGLNATDPIDDMAAIDALVLRNIFPDGRKNITRRGYSAHSSIDAGNAVRGLFTYTSSAGVSKLIGVGNNKLWDATSSGAATDKTSSMSVTNDDWYGTQFRSRLLLFNGTDTPLQYDGSSFSVATYSGATGSTLIFPTEYRNRLYVVEKNSTSCWYGGTNAITGALTEFDFGAFFSKGGYLSFIGSYNQVNQAATQSVFFAVSSQGELLAYQGSDPSSWTLIGKYPVGKPLGRRAAIRLESDTWILTERGVVPLSTLFQGNNLLFAESVSRKINPILNSLATAYMSNWGWEGVYYPGGRQLIINIPFSADGADQYVMNVETGAWCQYTEQPAHCWVVHDGSPYFGDSAGNIRKADSGLLDIADPIIFDQLNSFSFFGYRGNWKRFVDSRPLIRGPEGAIVGVRMETNFEQRPLTSYPSVESLSSTPWGSPWGSSWSPGDVYTFKRLGLADQGHSGAVRLFGTIANSRLEFNATEVRFELGAQQ